MINDRGHVWIIEVLSRDGTQNFVGRNGDLLIVSFEELCCAFSRHGDHYFLCLLALTLASCGIVFSLSAISTCLCLDYYLDMLRFSVWRAKGTVWVNFLSFSKIEFTRGLWPNFGIGLALNDSLECSLLGPIDLGARSCLSKDLTSVWRRNSRLLRWGWITEGACSLSIWWRPSGPRDCERRVCLSASNGDWLVSIKGFFFFFLS